MLSKVGEDAPCSVSWSFYTPTDTEFESGTCCSSKLSLSLIVHFHFFWIESSTPMWPLAYEKSRPNLELEMPIAVLLVWMRDQCVTDRQGTQADRWPDGSRSSGIHFLGFFPLHLDRWQGCTVGLSPQDANHSKFPGSSSHWGVLHVDMLSGIWVHLQFLEFTYRLHKCALVVLLCPALSCEGQALLQHVLCHQTGSTSLSLPVYRILLFLRHEPC